MRKAWLNILVDGCWATGKGPHLSQVIFLAWILTTWHPAHACTHLHIGCFELRPCRMSWAMASTLVSCFATWQNFESTVKQQEIKQNKLCCKRSGIKGTSWRNQSAAKTCRKVSQPHFETAQNSGSAPQQSEVSHRPLSSTCWTPALGPRGPRREILGPWPLGPWAWAPSLTQRHVAMPSLA